MTALATSASSPCAPFRRRASRDGSRASGRGPRAYHLAMWFARPDRGDRSTHVSAAVKGGANEIGRLGGPWYQGSMDSLKILRLWAACAWADQKMHPGEAEAIERFIAVSDFTDAELVEARRFLAAPPAVNMDEVRELSPEAREGVYRAARGIVKLDRVVTDDEVAFLARLRDALDLDERIIARIEAE